MGSELHPRPEEPPQLLPDQELPHARSINRLESPHVGLDRIFIGPQGLRAGWSILLFAAFFYIFREIVGTVFFAAGLIDKNRDDSAISLLIGELIPFLALVGAAWFMALLEGRRILSYHLAGKYRAVRFLVGAAAGFAALSLLVGALAWGGWLQLSSSTLSPTDAWRNAVLWGCVFLVVGSVEEGLFRCYGLFTLHRGINFWWALVTQIAICLFLAMRHGDHGAWGVYLASLLGLFPCLMIHMSAAPHDGSFWQAAWVTSTVFGLYHTANGGENWIGVFAAASIGFVFCVSVRVTGSAWWAIGCHAAWDWAETYFYGTADSGLRGQGHLLSASPMGNPVWSGATDGPEGSLLVLAVILLLLLGLLALYGRTRPQTSEAMLSWPGQ